MNRNSDTFETHRPRLWGIAYRMLGSRAEADDMVQEAWLRWNRSAPGEIRAPEAWLVTATTRLCIDRLRQLRAERLSYVGPWLPEPLAIETAPPADHSSELASDLGSGEWDARHAELRGASYLDVGYRIVVSER